MKGGSEYHFTVQLSRLERRYNITLYLLKTRLHQFGPKVLPGNFLGYALHAEGIWKGDILVADIEELEQMDESEIHAWRLNAREVLTPLSGEKFIFPNADGKVKLSGVGQVLRTSTFIRDRPDRGEEQGHLLGESDGCPPQDSSTDNGGAKNDFWSTSGNYIYRHHGEPRVTLYAPREESFPIPLRYIDVTRARGTTLDVMLESRINDYWNVEGDRDISDAWAGFTRFTRLNEKNLQVNIHGPGSVDSWSLSGSGIYRHHVEPRVKLCVLKEESYPIPLEI